MNKNIGPFRVVNLSSGRRAVINALDLVAPKHYMYGLLEVDVTIPRQLIKEHKARTGEAFFVLHRRFRAQRLSSCTFLP